MEEILEIYGQLKRKGDFVRLAAKKFNRTPGTIKSHWIAVSVPEEHLGDFKELVMASLENEKKFLQTLQ